jgi:hypothetical protein
MLPILYTDTDQVRAVIGITDKDMSDTQITVRAPDKELTFDLLSWCPNYATISSTPPFGDALQLFSTYFIARLLVNSLQLGAMKAIGDGENTMERFSPADWDKIYSKLDERVEFYKRYILTNNPTYATVPVTPAYFQAAGLAIDPVLSTGT